MYKVFLALIFTLNVSCASGYLNPNQVDPALANLNQLRSATNFGGYWSPPSD